MLQLSDINFVKIVQEVLRELGANPHWLKLAITVNSEMENVADKIAKNGRSQSIRCRLFTR